MTTSSAELLCAPDAEWTELSMEGRGLLHVCPVVDGAPVSPGEVLLPDEDEDEGYARAELSEVLDDWIDSEPHEAIYALVHPTDFAQLARPLH